MRSLYDDKQDLNRTSLVTKINFNKKETRLNLQAKIVKQNKQNKIIFSKQLKPIKFLISFLENGKMIENFLLLRI